jgi:6-phosphogluconolactonase
MTSNPQIIVFSDEHWANESALLLESYVEEVCKKKGSCAVMLTGGRGAEKIYRAWSGQLMRRKNNLDFFFGDERCVASEDPESNYRMVCQALFPTGIPDRFSIHRVKGENTDRGAEAKRYGKTIPDKIDILLLSIGEDGHIASLFPKGEGLSEKNEPVIVVSAPKLPKLRFTITPKVIVAAEKIICLASGENKGEALAKAILDPDNIAEVPARLALAGTWLMDESAKRKYYCSNV